MRLCLPEDGFVSQVLRNSVFNSLARGLWPVRVSLVPCPRRVSPPVPRGAAVRGRPWPAHGPGLRQGGGNAAPPSGKGHGIFYTGEFTKCVTKCSDCPHSAVLLRFSNQPKCAVCSKARGGWGEFDPDLSVCPKAGQELSLFWGFCVFASQFCRTELRKEAALAMELLGLSKGIYTTGLCTLKNCISTIPLLTNCLKCSVYCISGFSSWFLL